MNFKLFLIIIGFINMQEQEAFQHYASEMRQQYEAVGATVQERYPIVHSVMGDEKPDFMLVVEFPNEQAFQQLFGSEEYKKLVPYREKAFKDLKVYISKK